MLSWEFAHFVLDTCLAVFISLVGPKYSCLVIVAVQTMQITCFVTFSSEAAAGRLSTRTSYMGVACHRRLLLRIIFNREHDIEPGWLDAALIESLGSYQD